MCDAAQLDNNTSTRYTIYQQQSALRDIGYYLTDCLYNKTLEKLGGKPVKDGYSFLFSPCKLKIKQDVWFELSVLSLSLSRWEKSKQALCLEKNVWNLTPLTSVSKSNPQLYYTGENKDISLIKTRQLFLAFCTIS